MRVITEPLGGSELTRAFLERKAPPDWYPGLSGAGSTLEFLASNAREIAAEFRGKDWLGSLSDAFGSAPETPARKRLRRAAADGIVVTTGQQPGLFGGPLYTLSKALSVLALANELEKRTGLAVAPVFWAATDDADFAESSSIVIPSSEGVLELTVEKVDEVHRPLADEPLPDMRALLDEFMRGVGSSSNSETIDLVREAYTRSRTVGESYLSLSRGILEPMGISVLDAAHPQVRHAGQSLLQRALGHADSIAKTLSERNSAITAAGFRAQVREVQTLSLVFRYSAEGKERISLATAAKAAKGAQPGELGATVLLRPIMERAILPTAAYVAGPAEIAYFAQVSAVAHALDAKQPIVVPRWSGTVLEPRVDKILSRYNLKPSDFVDPHALEGRQARASISTDIQALINKLRDAAGSIGGTIKSGGDAQLASDSVVTGLQRDISHRLDRFERRVAAAVKRKGTQELRDIQAARASLYPLGKPQERAVSFVALLARYGGELQSEMLAAANAHVAAMK